MGPRGKFALSQVSKHSNKIVRNMGVGGFFGVGSAIHITIPRGVCGSPGPVDRALSRSGMKRSPTVKVTKAWLRKVGVQLKDVEGLQAAVNRLLRNPRMSRCDKEGAVPLPFRCSSRRFPLLCAALGLLRSLLLPWPPPSPPP